MGRILPIKRHNMSASMTVSDMPGEYAENLDLAHTIDLYAQNPMW